MAWVPGRHCWVVDADRAFVEGTLSAVDGQKATVSIVGPGQPAGTQRVCLLDDLMARVPDQACVADMDDLQQLHTASVLNNLEMLFSAHQSATPGEGPCTIYSSVGPVLIAMNPFTELPIYGEKWLQAYLAASGDARANKRLGPHCYRTVEEVYSNLGATRRQSVVICGESGAGKTVTNRKMIEYLCQAQRSTSASPGSGGSITDTSKITEANALLESFGNAKTTRNDNSSRFGKYTRIWLEKRNRFEVSGCDVEHYLLERSRIPAQPPGERSYHIFYQLIRSDKGPKDYGLTGGVEAYRYVSAGAAIGGYDDAADFMRLEVAMEKAGFDKKIRYQIFESIAAVLFLGNVEFSGDVDSSEVDSRTTAPLKQASSLLGVSTEVLSLALTSNVMKPPNGAPIRKAISPEAASAQRDTIAKSIYARLFDNIVGFISSGLRPRNADGNHSQAVDGDQAIIGLLDIFGFEDMATNGFEQMFINLTNERIQHLFNGVMFQREVEVYRTEGITAAYDPGPGNLECVQLFTSPSNPPGIVKLLGESAFMKNGRDDEKLVNVFNSSFARHPHYKVCDPQDAQRVAKAKGLKASGNRKVGLDYRQCFQVRHYAGTVTYTVSSWVPKSIDSLMPHLTEAMCTSTKPHIVGLFDSDEDAAKEKATVGEKFTKQLEVLANTLELGQTVFVRCIKSNPQMVPGLVNRPLVLEQLIHGGVIAALEMRHRGLPERMDYESFCEEYAAFMGGKKKNKDHRRRVEQLLREVFGQPSEAAKAEFAFGSSRVFMKSHINSFLRALVSLLQRNCAKKLQRRWRKFMGTQLIQKVEEALQEYQAAEALATARGVESLASVKRALQGTFNLINPVYQVLEDARKLHGSDAFKVASHLPTDKINPLHKAVESLGVVVATAIRKKVAAEQLLGGRVARAMDSVLRQLERLAVVKGECEDVADVVDGVELDGCFAACKTAQDYLEELQNKELSEIKRLGPVGVDLDGDGELTATEADVSPRTEEVMEKAAGLLAKAEEICHDLLAVRRRFQQAVEEVRGQKDDALNALEAMQDPVRRCVAEGLDGIGDKVDAAWQQSAEADEVLRAAKDADRYRAAVEALVASVREAEATIEKGLEELAKREAEKGERQKLLTQIEEVGEMLLARQTNLRKNLRLRFAGDKRVVQFSQEIAGLLDEVPELRDKARMDLIRWKSVVSDLTERAQVTVERLDAMVNEAAKARQDDFARRMNMFQQPSEKKRSDTEDVILDQTSFVQAENMGAHKAELMEISRLLQTLQTSGAPRSSVQRCLNHFMKCSWGSGTMPSTPTASSPSRFDWSQPSSGKGYVAGRQSMGSTLTPNTHRTPAPRSSSVKSRYPK
eukprot:TRINITY_DN6450_c0_g2_i1.p1 TRINITY_DN6450_c0_g2~~TRINITY_DN6450_c0_g2_i1.p1  ORF type:complete len:1372 (+),score=317.69 TRINITY_DN6450_c0_g2_i1:65-4117(+)